MLLLALCIFAYLLGSLSMAIILCKILKLPDPRAQGSGNPGATNVLRFAGKKVAIFVLLGDLLKGTIPVLIAMLVGLPAHLLGWVALAAFLGHLYPIFFGFKGGKGVATAFGGILVLSWPLALALIATWLMTATIFRYSSLAAIVATILAPVYGYWLVGSGNYLPLVFMSILLLMRHMNNMQRLWAGAEGKIGNKSQH